jgi:hypothetical protein
LLVEAQDRRMTRFSPWRLSRLPTEVRRARDYLLHNARHHHGMIAPDRYTSTVAVIEPDTFLMRRLC